MPVFTLISSGQQALERMGIKCLLISACSVVILRKRVPNAVVVCFVIDEARRNMNSSPRRTPGSGSAVALRYRIPASAGMTATFYFIGPEQYF